MANIIPVKPNIGKIKADLVGRTIYGVNDGYFQDSWRCRISDSTVIKSVNILEEKRPDKYNID